MSHGSVIQPAFPILQFFRGYAMQLSDIVACSQHILARYSIPMVHV
jgi:hypothetical protein